MRSLLINNPMSRRRCSPFLDDTDRRIALCQPMGCGFLDASVLEIDPGVPRLDSLVTLVVAKKVMAKDSNNLEKVCASRWCLISSL